MKKSGSQLVFPIIVAAVSLYALLMNIQTGYIVSYLISGVGLTGSVLYLLSKKFATTLFYIWIVSQLLTIVTPGFIYYFYQPIDFLAGISFTSQGAKFTFNFLPLFYFIGYRILQMYDLIGKKISIKPFKADSLLTSIDGEISEIVNRGKNGRWLKVSFQNEKQELQSVLIKPKGEERFSKRKSIMAFVNDAEGEQKFLDWGKVRLK